MRVKRFLLIGFAVVCGLFALILVLAIIFPTSEENTSPAATAAPSIETMPISTPTTSIPTPQPSNMKAAVHVLPGAVQVTNNNDFPWYGLIITVNGRYSTRYYFGDPGRTYLRADSIEEPGEFTSMGLEDNFIDRNGNEIERIPYTITVRQVELEAKTRVDGPYDLKFSIATKNANATPTPERLTVLRIHSIPSFDSTWVKPHRPEYQAILAFVSKYPQDPFGAYRLPSEAYEEMQARFNLDAPITDGNQAALDRWKEQFEVHWPNIDAFNAAMSAVTADRIISEEESEHICFALDQWTAQMIAVRDYVEEYEQVDPETVLGNPALGDLKSEVERALALLAEAKC